MDRPGQKLKQAREHLKLRYRDVCEASLEIAKRRGSEEFAIALSRLADIENKGTVPTIFRLYSLCAIYRLDLRVALEWYGIPLHELSADALQIELQETHAMQFPAVPAAVPKSFGETIVMERTTFLSPLIQRWERMPPNLLRGLDRRHRYGLIGSEDWRMYPMLHPGSLVVIDQNRRKIQKSGWHNQYDRPIYFVEHRGGFLCGWCSIDEDQTIVLAHPASECEPVILETAQIDVIGQVAGVAMLLEHDRRRKAREIV